MPLDPEEFKKRREMREQQRAKRKAQSRRTLIKLVVAGVALAACAALIFAIAKPDKKEPPASSGNQESTAQQSADTTKIHMAVAGDVNVTQRVVESGGGSYDYSKTFQDVAHLLADADITAVNFEGVLCGEPYGQSKSAPQSMLQALASAGVDLVQLANSYSIYKGVSGLATTIENVRGAGMEPVGAYATTAEAKEGKGYVICNVKGIQIAFVAFTKGMDGMALPAGSENCVNLLYKDYASTYREVDTEGITAMLTAAKEEKPDLIVAMLHWGSEYNDTLSGSQEEILALLQENGADAVIGTHSHYVQQMTLKDGQFVAYSLGDFIGDASRAGSEYSVVLDLEITKDNQTGETAITGFDYTPIFTVNEEGKPLRVMRTEQSIAAFEGGYIDRVAQSTYEAMQYSLERVDARIKGE